MAGGLSRQAPHLPRSAPIDAYGEGGFRLAGMSHRGSLLCLPDGLWAWPVKTSDEITEAALAPALERADPLDFFLLGVGAAPWALPEHLRLRFREAGVSLDGMPTGPAVSTYNILLGENRRVGAGLIAV
jgi:uncharacterized protein